MTTATKATGKKVAVLLRLPPSTVQKIDDYLRQLQDLGGSGSRASVASAALEKGLELMMRDGIARRR